MGTSRRGGAALPGSFQAGVARRKLPLLPRPHECSSRIVRDTVKWELASRSHGNPRCPVRAAKKDASAIAPRVKRPGATPFKRERRERRKWNLPAPGIPSDELEPCTGLCGNQGLD